jgi:3-oxoacyl-[acyl-carrier-protein] synthase II
MRRSPLDVAITGVGLVTPLGLDAADTWDSLLAGRTIHGEIGRVQWPRLSDEPRVTQVARRAGMEAVAAARWSRAGLTDEATALVVGTSKGTVDHWLPTSDNPAGGLNPESYGLAEIAAALAATFAIGGPTLTVCGACASGLHALVRGCMLIHASQASRVLVIAAESSLHPLFVACFRQLGVLTSGACRPFDIHRQGFNLSEAAAAVCLEATSHRSPLATVGHFALAGDASHITGGDPGGSTLRQVLARVLAGSPVDLIHAHGTATMANDSVELSALNDACREPGGHVVYLYSHKAALGHSLGASGLVSLVLSVLMHRKGTILPNVNTTTPMPTPPHLMVRATPAHRAIHRSLVLASGFGGAMAAVSLQM